MSGSLENHHSGPAHGASTNGADHHDKIHVRCPNPECNHSYSVPRSYAGKTARCKCGTSFPIPASPNARSDDLSTSVGDSERESSKTDRREAADVTEIHVGCIGRGNAGKTALLRALSEGPVGDFFPSGLHVDAADPREVARMIREAEEAEQLLHQVGLPPTLNASQIRYCLYDGAAQRVVYKLREVIGQVLTHTLPDSAGDQQARYDEYLRSLVATHVLWAVVPCPPPEPAPRDRRRYAHDLHITLAYLREALRLRVGERPVAVALVLSKIDALFADTDAARAALTDDVLRASFGPLVHLVEQSPQVSDAAIIPVSSFGFGNAVLRENAEPREAHPELDGEPFGAEPTWLLREGVSARPYNLDTLLIWTLLHGLLGEDRCGSNDDDVQLGGICRTLRDDLESVGPWLLPIKTDAAGESLQTAETDART